jgi:acetyl-CoA C-acetyltransferase
MKRFYKGYVMSLALIFDALRTPRGRGKNTGGLHSERPIWLARTVLAAIAERNRLPTKEINDVILGCVTQAAEQGTNIAKIAALYAGYDSGVAGFTINRFCASGLEAVNQAAANIISGYCDVIVAGGIESMSRVPMMSDGGAWSVDPDVASTTAFIPQGISADLIATLKGYSRADVDQFALQSQKKAIKAWEEKRFQKSIVPVLDVNGKVVLDRDEHLRADTTLQNLAELKPSFEELGTKYGFDGVAIQRYPQVEKINHVHHAGNSSGIVDGAAAVLLASPEAGQRLGLKARAKIHSMTMTSDEPTIMLTGPVSATQKVLKKAKMNIGDIDLLEVNEAFASVVLNFADECKADMSKINVNGGAIALGHPLGATGAMLLGTALDELERKNLSTALITLCIGGGMGVATIIERV